MRQLAKRLHSDSFRFAALGLSTCTGLPGSCQASLCELSELQWMQANVPNQDTLIDLPSGHIVPPSPTASVASAAGVACRASDRRGGRRRTRLRRRRIMILINHNYKKPTKKAKKTKSNKSNKKRWRPTERERERERARAGKLNST